MKFMSSNALKIAQYRKWLPRIKFAKGPDLQEISSYPEAVAIYKSLMSGPGTMIDDTSLYVYARPDLKPEEIRWNEEELFRATDLDNTPVRAEVWLAVNDGSFITTYCGSTHGVWKQPLVIPDDCADFDIGMIPDVDPATSIYPADGQTLYQLLKRNTEYGDSFSPRYRACMNYKGGMQSTRISVDSLEEWTGPWQK